MLHDRRDAGAVDDDVEAQRRELTKRVVSGGVGENDVVCTLSPKRIGLGGVVMKQPRLLSLPRKQISSLLAGYIGAPQLDGNLADYVVAPALGDRAGVLGSLELARGCG